MKKSIAIFSIVALVAVFGMFSGSTNTADIAGDVVFTSAPQANINDVTPQAFLQGLQRVTSSIQQAAQGIDQAVQGISQVASAFGVVGKVVPSSSATLAYDLD